MFCCIYLVYRDLLPEEYICFDVLVVIKFDGYCLFSTMWDTWLPAIRNFTAALLVVDTMAHCAVPVNKYIRHLNNIPTVFKGLEIQFEGTVRLCNRHFPEIHTYFRLANWNRGCCPCRLHMPCVAAPADLCWPGYKSSRDDLRSYWPKGEDTSKILLEWSMFVHCKTCAVGCH